MLRFVLCGLLHHATSAKAGQDTCQRSCTGVNTHAFNQPEAYEVIGDHSRCFKLSSGSFSCLYVACEASGQAYTVTDASGKSSRCGSNLVGHQVDEMAVECEAVEQVCDTGGSIIKAAAELHRDVVANVLTSEFGTTVSKELMYHFDAGLFQPATDLRRAVRGSYILVLTRTDCPLPELINAASQNFEMLRMVSVTDVDGPLLVKVLQNSHGCLRSVEQDVLAKAVGLTEIDIDASKLGAEIGEPLDGVPAGLDFLDGNMDGRYEPINTGTDVEVYVFDSGIDPDHPEFGGRVVEGHTFVEDGTNTSDYHSHGTHCAGTVGGLNVGVAPDVTLIPMKVLNDAGEGAITWILAGLDVMVQQKQERSSISMVASMSLGAPTSSALNAAVDEAVRAGITVVVAAGNEDTQGADKSPCSAQKAICVGAVYAERGKELRVPRFSNYGSALSIWAQGVYVTSALARTDMYTKMSGTSMACPHVAGVVAQILWRHPTWTPFQVRNHLESKCNNNRWGLIKRSTAAVLQTSGEGRRGPIQCLAGDAVSSGLGTLVWVMFACAVLVFAN